MQDRTAMRSASRRVQKQEGMHDKSNIVVRAVRLHIRTMILSSPKFTS